MRSAAAAVEYHYAQTSAPAGNTSNAVAQLVDEMSRCTACEAHHSPFPACPPRVLQAFFRFSVILYDLQSKRILSSTPRLSMRIALLSLAVFWIICLTRSSSDLTGFAVSSFTFKCTFSLSRSLRLSSVALWPYGVHSFWQITLHNELWFGGIQRF